MREIFNNFRKDLTKYPTVVIDRNGEVLNLDKEWLASRLDELNYIRSINDESTEKVKKDNQEV